MSAEAACSFCGKAHTDVCRLIAGQSGYICDECISRCKKFLNADKTVDPTVAGKVIAAAEVMVPNDEDR